MAPRRLALLVLASALLAPGPSPALAAGEPDAGTQAAFVAELLTRVLAYDHRLPLRTRAEVVVAVVFRDGSADTASSLGEALEALSSGPTLSGRPLRVVLLAYRGPAELEQELASEKVTAAFVCSDLAPEVRRIAEVTRSRSVLSFCCDEQGAREALAVALVASGGRFKVVVNLAAARAEGAELDAGLLDLAELVQAQEERR